MTPVISYIVRAKLIRSLKDSDTDFISFEDKFQNQNPIIAREKAFNHYQNYIDVLLQGNDKTYTSDKQARCDLVNFINTGNTSKIKLGNTEIEFSDSFENGIGIYLVINLPIVNKTIKDKLDDTYLIHGIENFCPEDYVILMDGLLHEYWYYEYNKLDTKKQAINIDIKNLGIGPEKGTILKTPFVWDDYKNPCCL
jgi:hypothetical protein